MPRLHLQVRSLASRALLTAADHQNILVPTDFSAASAQALEYARHIANTFSASLQMIQVLENPSMAHGYVEMHAALPADYLDTLDKAAHARLEAQRIAVH